MRWIVAVSVLLTGLGVEARAEAGAPVEVSCAAVSRAQLEAGRPVRCEVALDLRGEALGPRAEPRVVKVPRRAVLGRKARLPQVVEPAAPRTIGVWSGTAMLRAQAPGAPCERPDAGDAVFPKGSLQVRRGALPIVEEAEPAACAEVG